MNASRDLYSVGNDFILSIRPIVPSPPIVITYDICYYWCCV